ncbi:hypothetical protein [Nocardia brasiliensis]|uniref:hypothetical protein n=1 Tax=Nocardia brasiliensis TaxID=37326 RepID=UPI001EEBAE0E|nr:hypothetical protein [Nocardia brasiliensis]
MGTCPGQGLLAQRIRCGRALLEITELPVEFVARRVGLSSATNLRRRFLLHSARRLAPTVEPFVPRVDPR